MPGELGQEMSAPLIIELLMKQLMFEVIDRRKKVYCPGISPRHHPPSPPLSSVSESVSDNSPAEGEGEGEEGEGEGQGEAEEG
eukprot:1023643-Heterocapsa_arctica.AAC.1